MRYWDTFDWIFFTFMSSMIAALVFFLFIAISEHFELQETLKADECQQISSIPTGKRVYCGKACWRNEMKVEYSCKSGVKIVYN